MKRGKKPLHFLMFLGACAVVAAIVMLLWNCLIPGIIGWSAINYWQALGLLVLSRLMLGGLGHMNNWHHKAEMHGHFHDIKRKMCNMSQEERRDFIRKRMNDMRDICDPADSDEKKED